MISLHPHWTLSDDGLDRMINDLYFAPSGRERALSDFEDGYRDNTFDESHPEHKVYEQTYDQKVIEQKYDNLESGK